MSNQKVIVKADASVVPSSASAMKAMARQFNLGGIGKVAISPDQKTFTFEFPSWEDATVEKFASEIPKRFKGVQAVVVEGTRQSARASEIVESLLSESTLSEAYTDKDYNSKKELIADFKAGKEISVYQPGPFGGSVPDGNVTIEGPHYPRPHKWYASAVVKNGVIVKVR